MVEYCEDKSEQQSVKFATNGHQTEVCFANDNCGEAGGDNDYEDDEAYEDGEYGEVNEEEQIIIFSRPIAAESHQVASGGLQRREPDHQLMPPSGKKQLDEHYSESSKELMLTNVEYSESQADAHAAHGGTEKRGKSSMNISCSPSVEFKRELKLLKNREAARQCRRKKKEYVKSLEERILELQGENAHLKRLLFNKEKKSKSLENNDTNKNSSSSDDNNNCKDHGDALQQVENHDENKAE